MDYPYHIETPGVSYLLLETYGRVAKYQVLVRKCSALFHEENSWGVRPLSDICDPFHESSKLLVGLRGSTAWKRIGPDLQVATVVFVKF